MVVLLPKIGSFVCPKLEAGNKLKVLSPKIGSFVAKNWKLEINWKFCCQNWKLEINGKFSCQNFWQQNISFQFFPNKLYFTSSGNITSKYLFLSNFCANFCQQNFQFLKKKIKLYNFFSKKLFFAIFSNQTSNLL